MYIDILKQKRELLQYDFDRRILKDTSSDPTQTYKNNIRELIKKLSKSEAQNSQHEATIEKYKAAYNDVLTKMKRYERKVTELENAMKNIKMANERDFVVEVDQSKKTDDTIRNVQKKLESISASDMMEEDNEDNEANDDENSSDSEIDPEEEKSYVPRRKNRPVA
jgi:hypothetical protein